MNPQSLQLNPISLRSRFAKGFLRALRKINKRKPTSSSAREAFQRYYRVKTAADKSLACAVGSRRAWSRAILFRIRNQTRNRRRANLVRTIKRQQIGMRRNNNNNNNNINGLKGVTKIGSSSRAGDGNQVEVIGQADELRKLIPGGKAMDFCRLLEEAAHYISCLNTQVQVMRCIADSYSPT